jgi:hypothetical protein
MSLPVSPRLIMAANMLAAATTTLGYLAGAKSSALSAYIIQGSSSSATSNEGRAEPFRVGLWKVVRARHRTTGRQVSVWSWDKRPVEAVEAMKKEVSLDHGCWRETRDTKELQASRQSGLPTNLQAIGSNWNSAFDTWTTPVSHVSTYI